MELKDHTIKFLKDIDEILQPLKRFFSQMIFLWLLYIIDQLNVLAIKVDPPV